MPCKSEKMKIKTILFQGFISLMLFEACLKDKAMVQPDSSVPVVDYRDAYIGTYHGKRLCTYWTISQPQVDTPFNGAINISVTKHPDLINSLIVESDTIPIDSAGTYSGFYQPQGYHNYSIAFRNDSVLISNFAGGLGGGTTCNTVGKK